MALAMIGVGDDRRRRMTGTEGEAWRLGGIW
jgi:hypothetical protein